MTVLQSAALGARQQVPGDAEARGGVGLCQGQAFDDLDAPVGRVTGADVPMPYSKVLEEIAYPHEPDVVRAVLATFRDL